jgi:cell division septum initiation protein DivIVA
VSDPTIEATAPEPLPWTAKMIAGTVFTPPRRAKDGYAKDEVDPFVKRVVDELARLERERDSVVTQNRALREAKANRHDPRGPSVMAIDSMVRATDQGETNLAAAHEEYRQTRARSRRLIEEEATRREADDYLTAARAIADTPAVPRELPPEPQATGDPVGDLEARHRHLQECQRLLDAWHQEDETRRGADDERRRALGEQVERFVGVLDRLATAVPDMRAEVIDLTPQVTEAAQAS